MLSLPHSLAPPKLSVWLCLLCEHLPACLLQERDRTRPPVLVITKHLSQLCTMVPEDKAFSVPQRKDHGQQMLLNIQPRTMAQRRTLSKQRQGSLPTQQLREDVSEGSKDDVIARVPEEES